MLATNTTASMRPAPNATSAGPGQKPASPQPTPNTTLPSTSRLSIVRAVGRDIGTPSRLSLRRPARANPIAPTPIAPAITNARDGSQRPKMSRKPSTFAGFAMPETMRPMPKMRPARSDVKAYTSAPQQVSHHVHGGESRGHEGERRDERARRQARQSAHAM